MSVTIDIFDLAKDKANGKPFYVNFSTENDTSSFHSLLCVFDDYKKLYKEIKSHIEPLQEEIKSSETYFERYFENLSSLRQSSEVRAAGGYCLENNVLDVTYWNIGERKDYSNLKISNLSEEELKKLCKKLDKLGVTAM